MKIVNLTPHAIVIPETLAPDNLGAWTLEPSGTIARVTETAVDAAPIGYIPTTYVRYGDIEGLPAIQWIDLPHPCYQPGALSEGSDQCLVCGAIGCHVPGNLRTPAVYYVISSLTADVAIRSGRCTDDLLTPSQPIRDAAGRIIGCKSLARVRG